MGNFKIIKKGYSQLEVDSYIERLINDYETKLSEQKDRIFYLKDQLDKISNSSDNELVTSLVSAVERAKIIENSSKNIYELETKKLSLLYNKMESSLQEENVYNNKSIKQELLLLIKDCRKSLQNNILMQSQNLKESAIADPVKKLLSKMIGFNKVAEEKTITKNEDFNNSSINNSYKNIAEAKNEFNTSSKPVQIKRQDVKEKQIQKNNTVQEHKAFDEYLSKNDDINGANFENIMFASKKKSEKSDYYVIGGELGDYSPNESGFDLKEAINPKDDLDEIMKAFDFYNDNKKK